MEIGDIWEEFGLGDLEAKIAVLFPDTEISLETLLEKLLQGDLFGMLYELWRGITGEMVGNLTSLRELFVWVLMIGLIGTVVIHYADLFPKYQVGELGFYFLYLLQGAVLIRSFLEIRDTAITALDNIVLFVKLIMPTYLLTLGLTTGSLTAGAGSQLIVFLIYGVEELLKGFLMPLVTGYVLLAVLSGLQRQGGIEWMQRLFEKALIWGTKGALGVVTGIGFLQRLLLPALDAATGTVLEKIIGAIPGIGNSAESLIRLTASCSLVIRSSMGILFLGLLFTLCLTPLLQILVVSILLKLAAALMGVVSDKRMIKMVDQAGEAGVLLFRVVGTGMLLFLIAIALSIASLHV